MRHFALRNILLAATWSGLLLAPAQSNAEDWPGWRGPTGVGLANEKDLPLTWGGSFVFKAGPQLEILATNTLPGGSFEGPSPAVSGGKIFLRCAASELYCIGKEAHSGG